MASSILELLWQRRYQSEMKVFFYDGDVCQGQWSYGQILKLAADYSVSLKNLPSRSTIAISLANGPSFLAAFFGCQLASHIPAPFPSPMALKFQNKYALDSDFFKKSNIQYMITNEPEIFHNFPDLQIISPDIKNVFNDSIDEINLQNLAPDFTIQFSSGSTAEPKGVIITHKSLMENLKQISSALKVTQADRLSSWLPLYHDMGLVGSLMAPLYNNVEAHLSNPTDFIQDPLGWLTAVANRKTSILLGPDFMYRNLSKKQQQTREFSGDLSCLRVCMSGSEPVHPETCKKFLYAFSNYNLNHNTLLPVYGMAEAVLAVTFPPLNRPVVISPRGHVSCGLPLSEIQIQIRSESGALVADSQEGDIWVSGPNISGKFLFNQEAQFENGFLATGDLGYIEKGELFVTGRKKDVLIIRGQKFHNLDLERKIQAELGETAGRVAVVSSLEKLVVAVETAQWWREGQYRKIIIPFLNKLDANLTWSFFLVPKGSLARTTSGKLKRHQIKKDYENGRLQTSTAQKLLFTLSSHLKRTFIFLKSSTHLVSTTHHASYDPILDSVSRVLIKHKINFTITPDTRIDELGLDSIQTVELINSLENYFGPIDMLDFLEMKTFNDFKNYINSRR